MFYLLEYYVDFNCRGICWKIFFKIFVYCLYCWNYNVNVDVEGNILLWEVMVEGYEKIVKVLLEYGVIIEVGDVGYFVCIVVE